MQILPFNIIKSIDDKNKINVNNPAVKIDAPFNIKFDFIFVFFRVSDSTEWEKNSSSFA